MLSLLTCEVEDVGAVSVLDVFTFLDLEEEEVSPFLLVLGELGENLTDASFFLGELASILEALDLARQ